MIQFAHGHILYNTLTRKKRCECWRDDVPSKTRTQLTGSGASAGILFTLFRARTHVETREELNTALRATAAATPAGGAALRTVDARAPEKRTPRFAPPPPLRGQYGVGATAARRRRRAPRGHHGIEHRASRLRRRYAANIGLIGATADRQRRRAVRAGTTERNTALRATAAATRPTANTALGATANRRLRRAPRGRRGIEQRASRHRHRRHRQPPAAPRSARAPRN